ncbi:hypothetical protein [Algoriphagus aquimarinus]|uniref:hypothetical protein n=1 Tax=Algoriphagus aquimarinus TaxID=237018 RepID=UPI0030DAE334|tara:strand:- start:2601 stop:2915 length:315 start_codon:yes stop_codon:yes gene_type:complete
MKLAVITAIKSYEKDIKKILKQASILSYSYQYVVGFRDSSLEDLESNWFGSEMNESESILFFIFIRKEELDVLFEKFIKFNEESDSVSKIHISVLGIEKSTEQN